jgi:hypothetical protein
MTESQRHIPGALVVDHGLKDRSQAFSVPRCFHRVVRRAYQLNDLSDRLYRCVFLLLWCSGCGSEVSVGTKSNWTVPPEGVYVLAVSFVGEPFYPMIFDARVEAGAKPTITLQPLSATDRMTPVGAPASSDSYSASTSATYVAHFAMMLPEEAAPFWSNHDVRAEFQLQAQEPTCGLVGGLLQPVNSAEPGTDVPWSMSGSTFGMLPGTLSAAHLYPLIDCEGTHAPLP